jgi:long-chain acyl-CoA synthetase
MLLTAVYRLIFLRVLICMKDFPWFESYPQGVPHEIKLFEYGSVLELFDASIVKYGTRVAFENMSTRLTFAEVDELSRNFAAYLQNELNLKKGDRIAIQMPNLLQFPVAFFGAMRAGLIVVNTNPLYTPREMEHQFIDAEISGIVIVSNFASNLEKILGKTKIKHVIVTQLGDMLGPVKGSIVNFFIKQVRKLVPAYSLPHAIAFNVALQKGASLKFNRPILTNYDIAVLQYTGGTTGVSKGAVLSHGNLVAHNSMITHWFKPYMNTNENDVIITAIPMYHIFALTVNGILMFSKGAKNVMITNPRDMAGFCRELRKHKFSIITGVNTLFNGLLNSPGFKKLSFARLKGAIGGAMAIQDIVAKQWEEVTGKPLVEGYGLSETSPVLCCNPLNGKHKKGSIGIPMPSTEVAIFNDNGQQLPQGATGEICARGPQVMSGYWNKDNTHVFYPGGWFKTGDIGVMDKDGYFKIVDRKKDMIKVSGFNVFPNEIENVIASHPKVLEVAAIGVPDLKSGEVIKAFVVKKDETLEASELITYCHENLTSYKVPKYVEFRKELPKTNVGKILRRKLKEETATPY